MDGRDAPNPLLPQSECTRSVPYFLLPPSYSFAVTLIQLLGQDGCHRQAGGSCATLLSSKRRKRAMFLIPSYGHYNVTQTNSLNSNLPYPVITNYPAPNSFKFEVAKQWTCVGVHRRHPSDPSFYDFISFPRGSIKPARHVGSNHPLLRSCL